MMLTDVAKYKLIVFGNLCAFNCLFAAQRLSTVWGPYAGLTFKIFVRVSYINTECTSLRKTESLQLFCAAALAFEQLACKVSIIMIEILGSLLKLLRIVQLSIIPKLILYQNGTSPNFLKLFQSH